MTLDESLTLLFVPTCKITIVGPRFKNGFRKSFMSSIVAPWKILTLTEFVLLLTVCFRRFREAWNPPQLTLFLLPFGLG